MKETITVEPELEAMPDFDATMIAEGAYPADEATQLRAWQHLVDTGLAWKLQGWFGRTAADLIDSGLIRRAEDKVPEDLLRPTL